jgi:hypothetical protein
MAALLCPQDIAGATKFQIAHGDIETSAHGAKFLDGPQPLRGNGGEVLLLVEQQVAVGAMLIAADAAP